MIARCGSKSPTHRAKPCPECRRLYRHVEHRARVRRCRQCNAAFDPMSHAHRYCTEACKAHARKARRLERGAIPRNPRVEKVWLRTPLNMVTDALYAACNGDHTDSGEVIRREVVGEERWLRVCVECGVPYGKRATWNRKFTEKEEAA